jgi:pimeloyl-ACP methyl ester carboxylesterase
MPTTLPPLHIAAPAGDGETLILVHGGWTDHTTFDAIAGPLAGSFRLIRYDRRGHTLSRAARAGAPTRRRTDEDDLAAIVEDLAPGGAHLMGTSYGASIVLALAGRRPDLVRSVLAHEPPLMSLAPDPEVDALFARVQRQIAAGDAEGGTRGFFEDVVLGPGGWDLVPETLRRAATANAQTFADLAEIDDWDTIDLDALARYDGPLVITHGDQSPAWLPRTARAVAARAGRDLRVIEGAGHAPHLTTPGALVALIEEVAATAKPGARAAA